MSLEIINQQGYQVVNLQNEVASLRRVIALLAANVSEGDNEFSLHEDAADDIQNVEWEPSPSGKIIFKLSRK